MTPAARISAAVEILADIDARRRPATDALKDWGLSHRFAGSKDRAAIASLVYDALRRKASAAWIMGEGTPRAIMLGMLKLQRGLSPDAIGALCSGERFAPEPLTADERERLERADLSTAPAPVAGDFPNWIEPSLRRLFGDDLVPEMQALTTRAPLDLRVNRLKVSSRDEAHDALPHLNAIETPLSPLGLRIAPSEDGRGPAVQSEPEFLKGWIEIQDEGSQLVALLSGAKPGEQVVDLCAGGGGKTLALAAQMENHGQIYATDNDARRLAPIHDRLNRAGVRNVQVRTPRARADAVTDLDGKIDCVLVDAPCTGIGTWRRNPDAKWRLRPGSLEVRRNEQATVLDRAAALVKPGGRIVYITCSILPEENDDALSAFMERHAGFSPIPFDTVLEQAGLGSLKASVRPTAHGLQLTPHTTGTDGFYAAILVRNP
ncbi:RsmB/NOP family class I SAM-dependent RNA methyltransferase [Microvirga sp. 3-52]|uniref:RsmB/NOP family class I SAM-dependent RNA methyltransferase n=1 Tax=Microvirga sp. 3-52 TaxID=2792425 RepID=UPI001AD33AA6|nr:RsmB/NOP family class I SAM-dependent RNA methyltransferase [Microvirga sp. 3-52]MBO1903806.1 RsmB/NOP family class I SAM-dependent RNA methyltransferase [Microvirga sp. 3-52]MBS7451226.1 RsmB/NOP family class I SAM-dependent RNA methyltransferase [Microvirga sp. 3-52]